MQKIIDWFIKSSANSEQLSLTVKGFLVGAIPTLVVVANLFGITLIPNDLNGLSEAVINLGGAVLLVVSSATTVYGFARKIYLTALKK